MEISALFIGLIWSLGVCKLNSAPSLNDFGDGLKQKAGFTEDRTAASSVKCKLQGGARLPAFSMDGDFVIGGVFSIHYYMHTVKHNYTTMPEQLRCTGRLVRGRSCGNVEVTLCGDGNVFDLYDVLTVNLQAFIKHHKLFLSHFLPNEYLHISFLLVKSLVNE